MKDSLKIGIVAGEHSGDILGENLLIALKVLRILRFMVLADQEWKTKA